MGSSVHVETWRSRLRVISRRVFVYNVFQQVFCSHSIFLSPPSLPYIPTLSSPSCPFPPLTRTHAHTYTTGLDVGKGNLQWKTSFIQDRDSATRIRTSSGSIYVLKGPMDASANKEVRASMCHVSLPSHPRRENRQWMDMKSGAWRGIAAAMLA